MWYFYYNILLTDCSCVVDDSFAYFYLYLPYLSVYLSPLQIHFLYDHDFFCLDLRVYFEDYVLDWAMLSLMNLNLMCVRLRSDVFSLVVWKKSIKNILTRCFFKQFLGNFKDCRWIVYYFFGGKLTSDGVWETFHESRLLDPASVAPSFQFLIVLPSCQLYL